MTRNAITGVRLTLFRRSLPFLSREPKRRTTPYESLTLSDAAIRDTGEPDSLSGPSGEGRKPPAGPAPGERTPMIPILMLLVATGGCHLEIVPVEVTLPSQAQFEFRTKVKPVSCPQEVSCKTSVGTITQDTCILVAPRVIKAPIKFTVSAAPTANPTKKTTVRVKVTPE